MESEYPSPSGLFSVLISPLEIRMSHWIERPILIEKPSHKVLLDLGDSLWNANSATWQDDFTVVLEIQRYPGNRDPVILSVHVKTGDCVLTLGDKTFATDASQVLGELEKYYGFFLRIY